MPEARCWEELGGIKLCVYRGLLIAVAPPSLRELAEGLARRGHVDVIASSLDEAVLLKARLAEEEVLAKAKSTARKIYSPSLRIAHEAPNAEIAFAYEVASLALKLAAGERLEGNIPKDAAKIAEELAHAIAEAPALIKGDLAGRIYNEALRDLAKRKGLAAYYTEAPAAHLLARLAASAVADRRSLKVADFACGAGALLAAAYIALSREASLPRVELYGVEADPFAADIAEASLGLLGAHAKIFKIPLGLEGGEPRLGGLELFRRRPPELPEELDLVIMNPPFTRATGRGRRLRGRGLFDFLEEGQGVLAKAYGRLRREVLEAWRGAVATRAGLFPERIRRIIEGEAPQYLAIGQAGEGALFLYLAHLYLGEGGVLAFVLPRAFLSGTSWFLARALLASQYEVKYVVVSADPSGYNFSEGSSLSEVLVVARKGAGRGRAKFVVLEKKPRASVDAVALAEELRGAVGRASIDGAEAVVVEVDGGDLVELADNWGVFAAVPDAALLRVVKELARGVVEAGDRALEIPTAKLGEIIDSIGVDRRQFHDMFERAEGETPYPAMLGGGEEVRRRMLAPSPSYIRPRSRRGDEAFRKHSARVLVPDRIRWDTAHVLALYSPTPVLSNMFYAVRLKCAEPEAEKALVLWLNSSWGILMALAHRGETEGAWSQIKMGQWRLMPTLNVCRLGAEGLRALAEAFDELAGAEPARLPRQFGGDVVRRAVDEAVIRALGGEPGAWLDELYSRLGALLSLLTRWS